MNIHNDQQLNSDAYLEDLGIADLPEEERNEILADIGEVIFQSVMRKVWQSLDIDGQDVLTEILEASAREPENEAHSTALDVFLKERVPDFDRYLAEEVQAFRDSQEKIYGELTS